MVIDLNTMFNYQIICNESSIVGMIHSYDTSILSLRYKGLNLILDRKKITASIVKAALVEE